MSRPKFFSGPPPHIGWWLTRLSRSNPEWPGSEWIFWRWWRGYWTSGVRENSPAEMVGMVARTTIVVSTIGEIEWSDYYPPNARVPRVDPRKAQ